MSYYKIENVDVIVLHFSKSAAYQRRDRKNMSMMHFSSSPTKWVFQMFLQRYGVLCKELLLSQANSNNYQIIQNSAVQSLQC